MVLVTLAAATLLGVRAASGGVAAPGKALPLGTCRDPIAGVWQTRQYSATHEDWHFRTLYIRRVEGSKTALTGKVETEIWSGGADQHEPGPCTLGVHYAGTMPEATGSFEDPGFSFKGIGWQVDKVVCGTRAHAQGYNPDHFTGTLDRAREELRTVNNDGGRSVDEPTVFRRVACLDPPLPPPLIPPPMAVKPSPPTTAGCGCQAP